MLRSTPADLMRRYRKDNVTDIALVTKEFDKKLSIRELNVKHSVISASLSIRNITELAQSSVLSGVEKVWNGPYSLKVYYDRVKFYEEDYYFDTETSLIPLTNDRRRVLRYESNQGTVVVYSNVLTGETTFEFSNTNRPGNAVDDKHKDELYELDPLSGAVRYYTGREYDSD